MMSDAITFRIEGLDKLEKELLALPDKIARRSLARAAAEGAKMVRDYARENARSLGLVDTGTLVKSIRHKKTRQGVNWRTTQLYKIYHSPAPYKRKGSKTRWGGVFNYGRAYEYGFNHRGGWTQKPHVRPALDNNYERVAEAVKRRLELEIGIIQASGIARPR